MGEATIPKKPLLFTSDSPDSVLLTQYKLSQILCLHLPALSFSSTHKELMQSNHCKNMSDFFQGAFALRMPESKEARCSRFWLPGRRSEGSHFRGGWFYHITDQLDLFKLFIFMVSIDNAQHVYIHILWIAS